MVQCAVELGHDPDLWHVDALTTTTQISLKHGKEIVDEYVNLGLRNIHIRPLNPFGFATKTWRMIGYTMEEWLAYYESVLDYILELNQEGVQIMEGTAATFLKKLLTDTDPNFVDIRSPVGSGTGQICYGYDGSIFPVTKGAWFMEWAMTSSRSAMWITPRGMKPPITRRFEPSPRPRTWMPFRNAKVVGTHPTVEFDRCITICKWAIYLVSAR